MRLTPSTIALKELSPGRLTNLLVGSTKDLESGFKGVNLNAW